MGSPYSSRYFIESRFGSPSSAKPRIIGTVGKEEERREVDGIEWGWEERRKEAELRAAVRTPRGDQLSARGV